MNASDTMLQHLGLSAEELRTLARRRSTEPDETSHRKHPRTPYTLPHGVIAELLEPTELPDLLRMFPQDLSAGGMGVLLRGWLGGGTPLAVCLPKSATDLFRVKGRVVRCFALTGDVYDIGIEFENQIEHEPLLAFARTVASH
jgi:hypothetical protein